MFENLKTKILKSTDKERYNYMLLDRLKMDCEYFLDYGNRNVKRLWAGNVEDQINKMRELYNSFPFYKKPRWINLKKIDNYKRMMED